MLSIKIMAHASRKTWAVALSRTLDAQIIWDERNHPWDTGRRALLAGTGAHVAVIQDDAVASEGLVDSLHRLVEYSGDNPVGLYAGAGKRTRAALALGPTSFWTGPGPTWGVGVVIPTAHVEPLVDFGDRYRSHSYDQRLWHYYQAKMDCWYTVPSLVDHRDEGSLLSKGRLPRKAERFGSGLDVDWSAHPIPTDKNTLYPVVEMRKDGLVKKARSGTLAHTRLVKLGWE